MHICMTYLNEGDEVLVPNPGYPTYRSAVKLAGGVCVDYDLTEANDWQPDFAQLESQDLSKVKLLFVNYPHMPTGAPATQELFEEGVAFAKKHRILLCHDNPYSLILNKKAPISLLSVDGAKEVAIELNSMSKSHNMAGWRLGWLVMPPSMTHHMGKLVEFNTSCASVFTQRAGIAALQHADEITPRVVAHLQQCRDTLVPLLQALPGVEVASARGGMYAFFRLPGHGDSLTTAKRLVAEAGLGLAPGNAFGDEAQGWLRWCFASKDPQRLVQGVGRLKNWLGL